MIGTNLSGALLSNPFGNRNIVSVGQPYGMMRRYRSPFP